MDEFTYNANFTSNRVPKLMCVIEEGKIYNVDYNGKQLVGYTVVAYDELQEITNEYYNKLVEEGIIKIPKTSEELLKETLDETKQALNESQMINREMLKLIKEMQAGGNSNELQSTSDNGTHNKDVSRQRGRNKSSDKSSDTSNAGSE